MINEARPKLLKARDRGKSGLWPKVVVTAVMLPSSAIEVIVNTECLPEKIDYLLDAYDNGMRLKTNPMVRILDVIII